MRILRYFQKRLQHFFKNFISKKYLQKNKCNVVVYSQQAGACIKVKKTGEYVSTSQPSFV